MYIFSYEGLWPIECIRGICSSLDGNNFASISTPHRGSVLTPGEEYTISPVLHGIRDYINILTVTHKAPMMTPSQTLTAST